MAFVSKIHPIHETSSGVRLRVIQGGLADRPRLRACWVRAADGGLICRWRRDGL